MNRICRAVFITCLFSCSVAVRADLLDPSRLDAVLRKSVDAQGYVDYAGIRQNSGSTLESFLTVVSDADLSGWPKKERLAFWINAYNARILELILTRPKLKKISDDFEMLNIPFPVAGRRLSPNDILFRVVLGRKNPDNQLGTIPGVSMDPPEPTALFALTAGAVGSPPLRRAAYTSENLALSIHENAVSFINDKRHVDLADGHLRLSSFFRWYRQDFQALGGVAASITTHFDEQHPAEDAAKLAQRFPRALYQFDWSVNDLKNKPVFQKSVPLHTDATDPDSVGAVSDSSAPLHPLLP